MAKISEKKIEKRKTIVAKTKATPDQGRQSYDWWNAGSKRDLASQVVSTAVFLKQQQLYRFRQASIWSRLYGNLPIFNSIGTNIQKMGGSQNLPIDRPTMNVIQSCVDTKVSRIIQSKPKPTFLTDNSDWKQRTLAKKLNGFITGEFYQTKAYEIGEEVLRDADVLGTGVIKTVETTDKRVGLERRLCTELLVDANDAMYARPRVMYEFKLTDRSVLKTMFPDSVGKIESAEQAFPDNSPESSETTSDQVMLVEAWRLPTSKEAGDGMHVISCSSGLLGDAEDWTKDLFPFTFLHSSKRMLGMWGQGCPERLMGTQVEINRLLITISKSINLVGVPRVFQEQGSKVLKAAHNNEIGAIVTYTGTKPSYEVAPCMPQEVYAQLQRLIEYGYQQEGVSQLAASSVKPAGLDSGEAQREYNANQSDRLALLSKNYSQMYVDLAYQVMDKATEIADREGKYQTVYPNKDGTRQIELPEISELSKNPFVIQCFDSSSLPRDPAGRKQSVIEYMQAGILTPQEGRRLLDFPDLEQVNKLAIAAEERIYKQLDDIVEHGTYDPPDPFTDLDLAEQLSTQYYNLYMAAGIPGSRADMLQTYFKAIQSLKMQAQSPAQPGAAIPGAGAPSPQAVPEAPPVSPMLQNSAA